MNKLLVLLFLLFSISFGLTSTVPGIVLSDQIGNSLNYAELIDSSGDSTNAENHQRVQQNMDDIFVTKDGTVFSRSLFDESHMPCGIYKNGKLKGKIFTCGPGSNGQNGAIDGYSDGRSIFITQQISYGNWVTGGFGVSVVGTNGMPQYREASGGYFKSYLFARTYGTTPLRAYMSLDEVRDRLYVVDEIDTMYVFNTQTFDSAYVNKIYISGLTHIAVKDNKIWGTVNNEIKLFDENGIYQNKKITFIKKPRRMKFSPKNELIVYDDSTHVIYFIKNPGQVNQTYRTFGIKNGYYATNGLHKDNALYPNLNGIGVDSIGNNYFSWGWWPTPTNTDLRVFNKNGKLLWRLSCHNFVQVPGFDDRSDGKDVYFMQTKLGINYSKPVAKKDSQVSYTYHKTESITPTSLFDATTYVRWINNKKYIFRIGMTGGEFQIFKSPGEFYIYNTIVAPYVGDNFGWYVDTLGTIWNTMGTPIKKYPIVDILPNDNLVYDVENPIIVPILTGVVNPRRVYYDPTTDEMVLVGYNDTLQYDGQWQNAGPLMARYTNANTTRDLQWMVRVDTVANSALGMVNHALKSISIVHPYIFGVYGGRIPQTVTVHDYATGTKIGEIYPGPEIAGHYNIGGVPAHLGWTDMMNSINATKRSNGEYVILVEDDLNSKTTMYRWCPSGTCDMSK